MKSPGAIELAILCLKKSNDIRMVSRRGYRETDYCSLASLLARNGFVEEATAKKAQKVGIYPTYPHEFEDGRVVQARAYPNELIGELRRFFTEEWRRTRSEKYFAERDPQALPYLKQFLSLPNCREAMGYIEVKSKE